MISNMGYDAVHPLDTCTALWSNMEYVYVLCLWKIVIESMMVTLPRGPVPRITYAPDKALSIP